MISPVRKGNDARYTALLLRLKHAPIEAGDISSTYRRLGPWTDLLFSREPSIAVAPPTVDTAITRHDAGCGSSQANRSNRLWKHNFYGEAGARYFSTSLNGLNSQLSATIISPAIQPIILRVRTRVRIPRGNRVHRRQASDTRRQSLSRLPSSANAELAQIVVTPAPYRRIRLKRTAEPKSQCDVLNLFQVTHFRGLLRATDIIGLPLPCFELTSRFPMEPARLAPVFPVAESPAVHADFGHGTAAVISERHSRNRLKFDYVNGRGGAWDFVVLARKALFRRKRPELAVLVRPPAHQRT
jgi:hypothetical protein